MKAALWEIETFDYHTAGEPFRIVPALPIMIEGGTARERREFAMTGDANKIRKLLVNEPRGHADMYGGFVVPPNDPGAHFGALFWHREGFSTVCGHGTMALGTWAVRSGLVRAPDDGETDVVIDIPSGRVTARITMAEGKVREVAFHNVPSYVVARDIEVKTADFGRLRVDLAWSGALYASLPAAAAGLEVTPSNLAKVIAAGHQVAAGLAGNPATQHPLKAGFEGVFGTIFHEPMTTTGPGLRQRNVSVFADGQVARSPSGSGTAARVALLSDQGDLAEGEILENYSIIDSRFAARVVDRAGGPEGGLVVEVSGRSFPVGQGKFTLDADDELGVGFVLR
ncbi:proline racemase family protein [Arthrobacter alpinus]|uniref:proline racemase family protein n=1 Tax=Arthrobacter alpinus TaxID=656366 RepID=UPI000A70EF58|nr:proline racemase family protein [Arthrobacter alpinus]